MSATTIHIEVTVAEFDDLRFGLLALDDNVLRRASIAEKNGDYAEGYRERARCSEIRRLMRQLNRAAGL